MFFILIKINDFFTIKNGIKNWSDFFNEYLSRNYFITVWSLMKTSFKNILSYFLYMKLTIRKTIMTNAFVLCHFSPFCTYDQINEWSHAISRFFSQHFRNNTAFLPGTFHVRAFSATNSLAMFRWWISKLACEHNIRTRLFV